ncbi:MAG: cytochrome c peroxidase, partial [Myxococcota bacterium]
RPAALRPTASTPLLLHNNTLWVSSPDDATIIALDPETLEVRQQIAAPGGPEHVAIVSGQLVVTLAEATEVLFLDPTTGSPTATVPVPCGGTRAVVGLQTPDTPPQVAVTCPYDDRLLILDPLTHTLRATLHTPARPTAIAASGDTVTVTSSHTGVVWRIGAASLLNHTSPDPWTPSALKAHHTTLTPIQPSPSDRNASLFDALAVDPDSGQVWGVYQSVDNDSDRNRPPSEGGYGSVIDGTPRIEPRLWGDGCGTGTFARFDGGRRVFSGPVALASQAGHIWIVNRFTQNVAVLRCRPEPSMPSNTDGLPELVAHFRIGAGARGIALDPGGQVAFIDVGFDHAIARLDLNQLQNTPIERPTLERRRDIGPLNLSVSAQLGRNLFHDATNTHLTPSGVVACATCHPNGGDDGLVWFLHTTGVSRRLRRTAPAWNARREAAPYHWDGEFATGAELAEDTIQQLMEGDALLIDTYAIAAYMDEVPLPPPRPLTPEEQALAQEGKRLFESTDVGCTQCHTGASWTNNTFHPQVVPPSADPDGAIDTVVTRPLRAVRARAPFLHDGRAGTLESIHAEHNPNDTHGRTQHLSPHQRQALRLYLETL